MTSRLVQGRTMIIGRLTGQFGKNRVRYYSEYQKRCEGWSLTVQGEGCHKRGDDWVGLGNNAAPTQMSPEATSTAARGYFDVPFYVNQGTWTNTVSTNSSSTPASSSSATSRSSASRRRTASRT